MQFRKNVADTPFAVANGANFRHGCDSVTGPS